MKPSSRRSSPPVVKNASLNSAQPTASVARPVTTLQPVIVPEKTLRFRRRIALFLILVLAVTALGTGAFVISLMLPSRARTDATAEVPETTEPDATADPEEVLADNKEVFAPVSEKGITPIEFVDQDSTRRFLESGGTQQSEQAVALALEWLAAQQLSDGSWAMETNKAKTKDEAKVLHRGGNKVAATAFGLLPFLGRGQTHRGSDTINRYTKLVDQGVKYLLTQQKSNGDLRGTGNMYTHALATLALCEDLSTSGDPVLRDPCQRAIDFIINAQDPRGGGWRYTPKQAGDTSVTGWQIQTLKIAQMAGLKIPRATWEKANQYLNEVALPGDRGYAYQKGNLGNWDPAPASMTACGILCRQYLFGGENFKSPTLARGADRLLEAPPSEKLRNMYYYYYATQALFNIGDERWNSWNPKMRELLISSQNQGKDLTLKGSWAPQGKRFTGYSGRLMTTSLALLTLEVYYRHLPLNRPELGNVLKDLEINGRPKNTRKK